MGYKIYKTGEKYSRDLVLTCDMVDKSYALKPYAFMTIAQDIAMDGADRLGFGFKELRPRDLAWVLSRMHIHYFDAPVWTDEVRLDTWHKGGDGPFFRRDYQLWKDGAVKVAATSSWVIINLQTRQMLHPEAMIEICGPNPQCTDSSLDASAPRLRMPRAIVPEKVCDHLVAYSDLDFNGHANNTRYIAWAMDCVDREVSGSMPVRDVYINYSKEILEGETVSIFRASEHTPDGVNYYFQGVVDGHDAFIAKLVFDDRSRQD